MSEKEKTVSRLRTAEWIFLCIFAAFSAVSISVAQIAVTGMAVMWIGQWIYSKHRPDFSPLAWPIAAFIVTSLISATLSLDPSESYKDSRDLLHYVIYFAAYNIFLFRIERVGTVFRILAAVGACVALLGIAQGVAYDIDMDHRPSGFQSHWMTYSGLLMFTLLATLALVLFDRKKKTDIWLFPAIFLMLTAILVTLTRSAWLGTTVGVFTLIALWKPRAVFVLPIMVAVLFVISPQSPQDRAKSIFDQYEKTNSKRLVIWKGGLKILAENKVFGIGQNSFSTAYEKVRPTGAWKPGHLHNNVLQIAVERGLVGLAAWLSIWIVALWQFAKSWKTKTNSVNRLPLTVGIGGILAFQTAGLFEYNFGDSEVHMLMLLILAAAMAASRQVTENNQTSKPSPR